MYLGLDGSDCSSHVTGWDAANDGDDVDLSTHNPPEIEVKYSVVSASTGATVFTGADTSLTNWEYFKLEVQSISGSPSAYEIYLKTTVLKWKDSWMQFDSVKPWGYVQVKYSYPDTGLVAEQEFIAMDCRDLLWFNGFVDEFGTINHWLGDLSTIQVELDFAAPSEFDTETTWVQACLDDSPLSPTGSVSLSCTTDSTAVTTIITV